MCFPVLFHQMISCEPFSFTESHHCLRLRLHTTDAPNSLRSFEKNVNFELWSWQWNCFWSICCRLICWRMGNYNPENSNCFGTWYYLSITVLFFWQSVLPVWFAFLQVVCSDSSRLNIYSQGSTQIITSHFQGKNLLVSVNYNYCACGFSENQFGRLKSRERNGEAEIARACINTTKLMTSIGSVIVPGIMWGTSKLGRNFRQSSKWSSQLPTASTGTGN